MRWMLNQPMSEHGDRQFPCAVSLRPLRANETQDERIAGTTIVAPISRAPVPGMTAGVDLMASTSSTAGVDYLAPARCRWQFHARTGRPRGSRGGSIAELRCDLTTRRVPLSTGALVRSPTPAPTMKPVTRLFATPSQPRSRWREEEIEALRRRSLPRSRWRRAVRQAPPQLELNRTSWTTGPQRPAVRSRRFLFSS